MAIDKADHPYGAGSHAPLADLREMPACYPIKGSVDSMLYHRPDSENYDPTIAEVWFDSPSAAEAARFSLAGGHSKDGRSSDYEPGGFAHPCEAAAVDANRSAAIGGIATVESGSATVDGIARAEGDSSGDTAAAAAGFAGLTAAVRGNGDKVAGAADAVEDVTTSALLRSDDDDDVGGGFPKWLLGLLLSLLGLLLLVLLLSQCGGDENPRNAAAATTTIAVA